MHLNYHVFVNVFNLVCNHITVLIMNFTIILAKYGVFSFAYCVGYCCYYIPYVIIQIWHALLIFTENNAGVVENSGTKINLFEFHLFPNLTDCSQIYCSSGNQEVIHQQNNNKISFHYVVTKSFTIQKKEIPLTST